MAPLSVLPGRIRFESPDIIGKFKASEYLAKEIEKLDGVLEASVNYRTGRILVKFNENQADKRLLTNSIKELMTPILQSNTGFCKSIKASPSPNPSPQGRGKLMVTPPIKGGGFEAGLLKHALIDAVAHTLLPKPFGILLPLAINTLKR